MSSSITRTTSNVLVANVSKNLALLVVLIIIPRVYGATDFGAFSLSLAITTPFFAFALIGARVLRLTAPSSLSTRSIELSLLATGLTALFGSALFALLFTPDENKDSAILILFSTVIAVGVYKWGDLFTELYAGELQLASQTKKLVIVSLISGIILALVSAIVAWVNLSFSVLLFAIALTGLMSAIFFSFTSHKHRTSGKAKVTLALKLGLPLGIAGAVGALMSATPQYVVAAFFGPEMVGILAVILYVFSIADLFGGAYAQAWIHKIKEHLSSTQQLRFAIKIGLNSSLAFLPIAIFGVWMFSVLAPMVFGARFTITASEAIPLIVAVTLLPLGHLISIALLVRIAYKQSLLIVVLSAVAVTLVSFISIPNLGITGALWAVTSGIAVRVFAPLFFNRTLLKSIES